jgi:hypothetical protein
MREKNEEWRIASTGVLGGPPPLAPQELSGAGPILFSGMWQKALE